MYMLSQYPIFRSLILLIHWLTFIYCVQYGKFLYINLWNLLSDVVDSDPANDELYTRMMEQKMKRQENKKGKGKRNNVCCVAGMKSNHFNLISKRIAQHFLLFIKKIC